MKKILYSVLVSCFALNANAITAVPSLNEINLSSETNSVTLKYGLDETISELHGKEGFIKGKFKLAKSAKKFFETNLPKSKLYIPFNETGISEESLPFSLSIIGGAEVPAGEYNYKIVFPKKYKKKFGLTNYEGQINVTNSESQQVITGKASTVTKKSQSSSIASFSSDDLEGKPVELHEMDENGNINPEVVSESVVGADGSYELPLPAGQNPGINYVVQVKEVDSDGDNTPDSTLDSIVTGRSSEVNPERDFVTDKIKESLASSELSFENLSNEEVKDLLDDIENINIVPKDNIDDTQAKYEDKLGPVVTNSINSIKDVNEEETPFDFEDGFKIKDFDPDDSIFKSDSSSANAIAGRYFYAGYSNIVSNNHHGAVSEVGEAFLAKPTETGVIKTVTIPNLRSESLLNTTGFTLTTEGEENGEVLDPPSLGCFQLQIATDRDLDRPDFDKGSSGSAFSIDSNNVITAISPESTSTNQVPGPRTIEFTSSSFVTDFLPAGAGMFIGTTFKLGSGIDADTGAPDIQEYQQGYSVLVKNSDFNEESDPLKAKSFAMVGISHTMTATGNEGVRSSYGVINFAEDISVNSEINHNEIKRSVATDVENTCGPITISSSSSVDNFEGVRKYDSRGKLFILDEAELSVSPRRRFSQLEGYIRPDAKIITFAAFSDLNIEGTAVRPGDSTTFDESETSRRDFYFATEILDSLPDVEGESYEMITYRAELDSDGNLTNYMPVSGSRDTLRISGGNVSIIFGTQNVIQGKAFSNLPTASTVTPSVSGFVPVTTGAKAGNSLEFTIGGEKYVGYITADAKQIIMTSYSSSSVALHFLVNTDFLTAPINP